MVNGACRYYDRDARVVIQSSEYALPFHFAIPLLSGVKTTYHLQSLPEALQASEPCQLQDDISSSSYMVAIKPFGHQSHGVKQQGRPPKIKTTMKNLEKTKRSQWRRERSVHMVLRGNRFPFFRPPYLCEYSPPSPSRVNMLPISAEN